MERQLPERFVQQSAPIKEIKCGIGSLAMVVNILRSDLYKNPIRIVCQEYISNARDAHREVGKEDVPIEITLPSEMDPTYKVRDWGPGINPERFEQVFSQYCESTKNSDNKQTGGFGIGGKSAWAYGDSFTIETCTDHIKRVYIGYVGDDNVGSFNLVDEAACDEENNTLILIPVKIDDIPHFEKWTNFVTNHWSPRPLVNRVLSKKVEVCKEDDDNDDDSGNNFEETVYQTVAKGARWECYNKSITGSATALVDGIPYSIDADQLNLPSDTPKNRKMARVLGIDSLVFHFQTGELALSASRESLKYTDITKAVLIERVAEMLKESETVFNKALTNCTSVWGAYCLLNSLQKTQILHIMLTESEETGLSWQGTPILLSALKGELEIQSWSHRRQRRDNPVIGVKHYFRGKKTALDGTVINIVHEAASGWNFSQNGALCFNDNDTTIVKARIETLFDQNPSIEVVNVVRFREIESSSRVIAFKQKYSWDKFGATPLASIAPRKVVYTKIGGGVTTRPKLCYRLDSDFTRVAVTEKLLEDGGYFLVRTGKTVMWGGQEFYYGNIKEKLNILNKLLKVDYKKLYVFNGRDAKHLDSDIWTNVLDLVTEEATNWQKGIEDWDFVKVLLEGNKYREYLNYGTFQTILSEKMLKHVHETTTFARMAPQIVYGSMMSEDREDKRALYKELFWYYTRGIQKLSNEDVANFAKLETSFDPLIREVRKKYPLLECFTNVHHYSGNQLTNMLKKIADYINSVDKLEALQNPHASAITLPCNSVSIQPLVMKAS